MDNLDVVAVNEYCLFHLYRYLLSDTFSYSPFIDAKYMVRISMLIVLFIRLDFFSFRLICSSTTQFMVASLAKSRRRMDNFSWRAKPFRSSMRRILALSVGAKLEPNILLNRQESSQPKKSMFLVQNFLMSTLKLTRFQSRSSFESWCQESHHYSTLERRPNVYMRC